MLRSRRIHIQGDGWTLRLFLISFDSSGVEQRDTDVVMRNLNGVTIRDVKRHVVVHTARQSI